MKSKMHPSLRGQVMLVALTFNTMPIAEAIGLLMAYQRDGHTHAKVVTSRYAPRAPRAPRVKLSTTPVRRGASPGKIRLNGRDGTVRHFDEVHPGSASHVDGNEPSKSA